MGKIIFDKGNVAEKVTGAGEQGNPGQAPGNVVFDESAVMHGADACYKGGKGADDGDEAAEEDGFGAVFFIKLLRFFHMFGLDQAIVAFQQFLPELFPYPVVAGVT